MAGGMEGRMAGEERRVHWRGPRAVGAVLPGVTQAIFRSRAPVAAQILADWGAVVGPGLAAVTVPRRLQGGTLTLACAGPMALELQHMSGEVLARVNGFVGAQVAQRLRLVQATLPSPVAAPARVLRSAPALPGVPDGALREALVALGRAVPGNRDA